MALPQPKPASKYAAKLVSSTLKSKHFPQKQSKASVLRKFFLPIHTNNPPFAYSTFTFSFNRQTLSSHVLNDNFAPKDAFLIVFCYLCSSKKSFIYT